MEEAVYRMEHRDSSLEAEYESIKDCLENVKDDTVKSDLFEKWRGICEELDINLNYVRNECDSWFQECYSSRSDVHKLNIDVSCDMAERRKEELFEKFCKIMEMLFDSCGDCIQQMCIKRELEAIKNFPSGYWVDKAIDCVEREKQLVADFQKQKYWPENEEVTRLVDLEIQKMNTYCSTLKQKVNELNNDIVNYQRFEKVQDEKQETIANIERVIAAMKATTATQKRLAELRKELDQCKHSMEVTLKTISVCIEEIFTMLAEGLNKFGSLTGDIVHHVNVWKREFQFEYAELAANPRLDRVAPWCAQVGKLLYDLVVETLPKLKTSLDTNNIQSNIDDLFQSYDGLLHSFMQETFVVTEQENYIIKVDKKHLPKMVVRVLAADYFPSHSSVIEPRFVYEDDINEYCSGKEISVKTMGEVPQCAQFEKAKRCTFQSGKKQKVSEGIFQNLQFKGKFVRPENTSNKQVHEEKYRILFITNICNHPLWTLSLPLVVTTGANQGCLCQASIMWQCFSTDVSKVPIETKNELEWSSVAEMLQYKMKKLCPSRPLNHDNLAHLENRLFGRASGHSNEPVSLKMFCFDKMKKTGGSDEEMLNFSFWKWFIGVYNLIDRYLLNFWKENLIFGFISKEVAREKLSKGGHHSGTFILRFSDQNITDSQGAKSVFAHLTSTVLIIKERDGCKKKCIYDFDVAGHSKLKIRNLANILMETQEKSSTKIYQYVYPKKKREETFDKHSNEEIVVAGYNGTRDAFIVDLSQALCALEIDTGKHARSPSVDSGFAPSPQGLETLAAPVKRSRPSVENPVIAKMLSNHSNSPSSSPAYSTHSSNYSGSPFHQPFSPNSYTGFQTLESPPSSLNHQSQSATLTSGCQYQDAVHAQLPTVIADVIDSQSRMVPKQSKIPSGKCSKNKRTSPADGKNSLKHSSVCCGTGTSVNGCSNLCDDSNSVLIDDTSGMEVTITDDGSGINENESNATVFAVLCKDGQYRLVQETLNAIQQQQEWSFTNQEAGSHVLQDLTLSANQNSDQAAIARELSVIVGKLMEMERNDPVLTSCAYAPESVGMTTHQADVTMNNPIDSVADIIVSSSANTIDMPVLTSSGSVGEAFNFSIPEIAEGKEMNSGNIDVNVFDMSSGSGGVPATENSSSGSS